MSMSILTCYGVRLFFIEPWPSFREEDAVVRERKSDIAVLAYCETQALVPLSDLQAVNSATLPYVRW